MVLARLKNILNGIAWGLLSAVAFAVFVESSAALLLRSIKNKQPVYMHDYPDSALNALYGSTNPEKYREVIGEFWRADNTHYEPFQEFAMTEFEGRHVNFTRQGFRSNGPAQAPFDSPTRKIFVFGGSTTLGAGVADDETIPAYLQSAVEAGGSRLKVFNFGIVGAYSTQERIVLEQLLTRGEVPAYAVFIDGLNDFYMCAVPDSSLWSERIANSMASWSRRPLLLELAQRSRVVTLFKALSGNTATLQDKKRGHDCSSDEDIDKVIQRLDANRKMVAGIAEKMGFNAIFVQQPVPTYAYDNSKRPVPVLPEMLGRHRNSSKGYQRMAAKRDAQGFLGYDPLWLVETNVEGAAYIDTVHYSPAMNKAISQQVAQAILDIEKRRK